MNPLIPRILLTPYNQLPRLLHIHPQHPRKKRDPQRLESRLTHQLREPAHLLIFLVRWPRPERLFYHFGLDVFEACLFQQAGDRAGVEEAAWRGGWVSVVERGEGGERGGGGLVFSVASWTLWYQMLIGESSLSVPSSL